MPGGQKRGIIPVPIPGYLDSGLARVQVREGEAQIGFPELSLMLQLVRDHGSHHQSWNYSRHAGPACSDDQALAELLSSASIYAVVDSGCC